MLGFPKRRERLRSGIERAPHPGWHALRFTPDSRKVATACAECGRPMWLPASRVSNYRRCSPACNKVWRNRDREKRRRECQTCGTSFVPRGVQIRQGQGLYCSQRCNPSLRASNFRPEIIERRRQTRAANDASGKNLYLTGPDHPKWSGGRVGYIARLRASGRLAEMLRDYRRRNPDKVRERVQSRKRRKAGRLPRGTVNRIGDAQRWKCAICRTSVAKHYHVDHIEPLARGGVHRPRNIQLLCPPCNVRKSAKDPIAYMQSLGRLL